MSADQPLTGDELATIKARAETGGGRIIAYAIDPADVLRLVAEIERLQADRDSYRRSYLELHNATTDTRW